MGGGGSCKDCRSRSPCHIKCLTFWLDCSTMFPVLIRAKNFAFGFSTGTSDLRVAPQSGTKTTQKVRTIPLLENEFAFRTTAVQYSACAHSIHYLAQRRPCQDGQSFLVGFIYLEKTRFLYKLSQRNSRTGPCA